MNRHECRDGIHDHGRRCLATDEQGRDAIDRRHYDEIDLAVEAMADPLRDHVPQSRPKHKVRGVLGILDQLDRDNSDRRSNL